LNVLTSVVMRMRGHACYVQHRVLVPKFCDPSLLLSQNSRIGLDESQVFLYEICHKFIIYKIVFMD